MKQIQCAKLGRSITTHYSAGKLLRCLACLLFVFMLSGMIAPDSAALAENPGITVEIDGSPLPGDVPPFISNGRTMVPLRPIFEALGLEVQWIGSANKVIGIKDGVRIELVTGEKTATVNGTAIALDAPAVIVNGRTFVPVRFIAESTGNTVDWEAASKTVCISSTNAEYVLDWNRTIFTDSPGVFEPGTLYKTSDSEFLLYDDKGSASKTHKLYRFNSDGGESVKSWSEENDGVNDSFTSLYKPTADGGIALLYRSYEDASGKSGNMTFVRSNTIYNILKLDGNLNTEWETTFYGRKYYDYDNYPGEIILNGLLTMDSGAIVAYGSIRELDRYSSSETGGVLKAQALIMQLNKQGKEISRTAFGDKHSLNHVFTTAVRSQNDLVFTGYKYETSRAGGYCWIGRLKIQDMK